MTSFWDSELGEISGNAADAFAKTFTQIPDGTMASAKIESFMNAEYQGNKYLSIDWTLTDGDFKGQKVNQKLKVFGDPRDKDPAKGRHRALNMFKLLYQLFGLKPMTANPPTDQELLSFIGKVAGIKIRETEPNAEGKQYNWVAEVHEAKGFKPETGVKLEVVHHRHDLTSAFDRNPKGVIDSGIGIQAEDDIPF